MRSLSLLLLMALPAQGAETCAEDAMLVIDGSGSMADAGNDQRGVPRIQDARVAVRKVLPEIEDVRDVGLVIYGPSRYGDCASARLHFGPQSRAAGAVIAAVDALEPEGGTPIAAAVIRAATALKDSPDRGTVVLVTDGRETCGGAPCALARDLAAEGGPVVHVIGFKVGDRRDRSEDAMPNDLPQTPARCLADETGGLYVGADTVDDLIAALRQTLGCALLF